MDGKMAASWPIQFTEGTDKTKKNMVTEDNKKNKRPMGHIAHLSNLG
jgi:hypothetical protein